MRSVPTWGLITAAPHEFLIRIRQGRVLLARQGGSCFRWPGDAVALIDTSVHRLQFTADQITREKTGVQVTGLAVFRIVQPLLAYRMLNCAEPGATEDILREMFVGATRRLVANLTLDECLTRRKEALAVELMAEVAPVLQGRGQEGDSTDRGWGVAIDTIEVQDVRVLSREVFERLQAPYREALALEALRAKAEVEAEAARVADAARRAAEERHRALMALEEARLVAERERASRAAAHAEELSRQHQEARLAREAAEAEAEALRETRRAAQALRLAEEEADSGVRQAELRARAERVERETRAAMLRLEREAVGEVSEARLQELLLTQTLPEVARAWRGSFDKVVLTGPGDASFVARGLTEALASLQALGLKLPSFDRS